MQISTLNKVINLFLVGFFVVSVILLFFYDKIIELLVLHKVDIKSISSESFALLLGTFFLLSVSIFIGLLVEGVTSILRTPFEAGIKKPFFAAIFGCSKPFEEYLYFCNEFKKLFKIKRANQLPVADESRYGSYAVAHLFISANAQTLDWAIQHYSTYLLTTNYILLFIIIIPIELLLTSFILFYKLLVFFLFLIIIYFLIHLAIDKFLYAYEVTFRHGVLSLLNDTLPTAEDESQKFSHESAQVSITT